MAHVIVLDSINEDIFVCGICKSVFNSINIFLDHKKVKCGNVVVEEQIINTGTAPAAASTNLHSRNAVKLNRNSGQSDITINGNKQMRQESLTCPECNKHFKKTKSLLIHMKIHNEKGYQCPVCGRSFCQNSHLQRHIPSHKLWPNGLSQTTAQTIEADLSSYNCPYCNLVFPNYSQFRSHLKIHSTLKKFKCIQGDCMEFYDTVESLIHHVDICHESVAYSCHLCSSTFNNLEDIATHQATHNNLGKDKPIKNSKPYKCTQCDAEFRKSEKLALHMLTENHKKTCIHCSKIFASDKRLRMHLQTHKKSKPFQCNVCNSSFLNKKYLTSHMLKHGNRQFKCSVCKITFKRSDLLQRHARLHQAKKVYKCPFKDSLACKKEFSRSDKLKSHIKSHTKHVSMNTTGISKLSEGKLCADFIL